MDVGPGSAGFGSRVGWFFAATGTQLREDMWRSILIRMSDFVLMLFGIFIIPELKGRSLEETDELFNANLKWGWQFKTYRTHGTGAQIAALELKDVSPLNKQVSPTMCSSEIHQDKSHQN
jgi:hypothetical protein